MKTIQRDLHAANIRGSVLNHSKSKTIIFGAECYKETTVVLRSRKLRIIAIETSQLV